MSWHNVNNGTFTVGFQPYGPVLHKNFPVSRVVIFQAMPVNAEMKIAHEVVLGKPLTVQEVVLDLYGLLGMPAPRPLAPDEMELYRFYLERVVERNRKMLPPSP